MASFHKSLCLFLTLLFALVAFSHAYTFTIGGRSGWTLNPSESYSSFSGRSRFIVNDNLHFKYDAATDSVLEVSKFDYDNCNINNPITNLTGGDSFFTLDRSGPFYFISGNKSHCDQGQKLEVVVISPKTTRSHSAAPASPPTGVTPLPNTPPMSSPPVPGTPMPTSPTMSPFPSPPEPGTTPVGSPDGGISSPPSGVPMGSPGGGPSAYSPDGGMPGSPAGAPASSPGGGISAPPSSTPSDMNAPPPASAAVRLPLSAALSASLVVMIFGFGWF